jgi:hypothetical protein
VTTRSDAKLVKIDGTASTKRSVEEERERDESLEVDIPKCGFQSVGLVCFLGFLVLGRADGP